MTAVISGTNGLLQSYDYQVPTTGFSYTFAAGTQVLVMNPAGTLATGTITMPASPADGMTITFSSTQTITALTVSANTGKTINNAVTTLAAGQSASYVYRTASTAWFPYSDVSVASSYAGVASTQFTSSGTFTVPTGITKVKVTVVGGGGGGGSGSGSGAGYGCGGNGGGGGGAAIKYLSGLTPGNTLTVTVGSAGGTSSVASGTQTITTISATGAGGIGSNGDINIRGGAGGSGGSTPANSGINVQGGNGGTSIMGGGGAGGSSSVGAAGGAYGGGGGGGGNLYQCSSWGNYAGGAGAGGIVLFEY